MRHKGEPMTTLSVLLKEYQSNLTSEQRRSLIRVRIFGFLLKSFVDFCRDNRLPATEIKIKNGGSVVWLPEGRTDRKTQMRRP